MSCQSIYTNCESQKSGKATYRNLGSFFLPKKTGHMAHGVVFHKNCTNGLLSVKYINNNNLFVFLHLFIFLFHFISHEQTVLPGETVRTNGCLPMPWFIPNSEIVNQIQLGNGYKLWDKQWSFNHKRPLHHLLKLVSTWVN